MRREWSSWRSLRSLNALPEAQRRVVFFSHARQDWPHLWPLAMSLAAGEGVHLTYVCATPDDPALTITQHGIRPFLLDSAMLRAAFLRTFTAKLLVATLPDLGAGPWKRSAWAERYVYVPHSLVSCHMIYRPGAFDAFDEIFCAGPHHAVELRRMEELRGSPRKNLFEFGYPRLDALMAEGLDTAQSIGAPRVLVAPSWGPCGLLETLGTELVAALLSGGCRVVVRPHPETTKRSPHCLKAILDRFGGDPRFEFDYAIEDYGSLMTADAMISDWSGAALEFAFGLGRPVIFFDTPRKVNNRDYEKLGIEPVEVAIRSELGVVLPPSRLDTLPELVRKLTKSARGSLAARVRDLRGRYVHNLGNAAVIGARRLCEILDKDQIA